MSLSLKNASIRTRLLTLAALSAVLIVSLFAATRLTDRKVDHAYQSIDTAQQTIQSAREAIDSSSKFKDEINLTQQRAMQLRVLEKTFLQFHSPEMKAGFDKVAGDLSADLQRLNQTAINAEFQDYRKAFEERATIQAAHDELNGRMTGPLQKSEQKLADIQAILEGKQAQKQMDGGSLIQDELELMSVTRDCKIAFLKLQTLSQQFLATGDQKFVEQYKQVAANEAQSGIRSLREFAKALNNTNFLDAGKTISASLDEFVKNIDQVLAYGAREKQLEQQLNAKGEAILKAANDQQAKADQDVLNQKTSAAKANELMQQARVAATAIKKTATIAVVLILLIGSAIYGPAFAWIVRSINRSLNATISRMDETTRQTAASANQVSSASQSLAEGASEQAASIEETSASLEEMSSMTKRNSENAQKANDLAKQTRTAADKGAADMETMNAAMEAIKVSSDDIAKIIKTIDEIAFQTNILALNAAVEAARAGEAGMGFAVVADEVRNLAQRSAQAAKETAAKIEGAISKTGQGVGISKKVAETLNEIVIKVRQVDELAAEVASASREQTQGITQINTAVGQMDKVTQSNAASAEESAAAAEELNSQAEVMKQSVAELLQLVGGQSEATVSQPVPAMRSREPIFPHQAPKPATPVKHLNGNGKHPVETKPVAVGARHAEIPMAGDFKDF